MKQTKKIAKFLMIFAIIAGWIFSGWPQIFNFPPEVQEAKAAPYPNGYSFRRLIDITDAQVSNGPHTNFPILFNSTILDLRTTANGGDVTDAEGDDIIFTDSNGTTQLAHEIERYTATTGALIAWVRVPSLAATSQIYIYYGNSSVTTFQGNVTSNGVTGVWDSNYKGVWHLKDLTTSTTDDSTSNNNDGAKGAANQPIEVDAKIGKGQDFTPTTQYLQIGTTGFSASSGTFEAWVKAEGFVNADPAQYIFGHTLFPAWSNRIQLYTDDTLGNLNLGLGDNHRRALDIQALNTATWYHIVLTWNGTNYIVYVDSVSKATGAYTGLTSIASLADIGNAGQPTERIESWNGIIDEVRISSVVRSAAWITTEYNNQSSPSGFYAIGAEETNPAFTQSAYRLFNNLDSTDVGTALAAQDTAATLGSAGAAFRLRMLLHISDAQLGLNGQNFKLQFAQQSGTCDTAFSGETYADVTAATVIAYNNNATPADGDNLTANANDPTHGADTIVNQDYEELNNFTNTVAAIPAGQDGKWDFSLIDNGALASTAYCFRAVKSDAAVLNTYTVIPQITTATVSNQAPTIGEVSLNSKQSPIILVENSQVDIIASVSVTDADGCSDISGVKAIVYRYDLNTASCSLNYNNCYDENQFNCVVDGSCVGNTQNYNCYASSSMYFFADPTTANASASFANDQWVVSAVASDSVGQDVASNSYDDDNESAVDVEALLALDVSTSINFEEIIAGSDTGSSPKEIGIKNTGNWGIDTLIAGTTPPTYSGNTIDYSYQKYASVSIDYSDAYNKTLSDTNSSFNVTILKPTNNNPGANDVQIFWGIGIPTGKPPGSYNGTNTFTATSDGTD